MNQVFGEFIEQASLGESNSLELSFTFNQTTTPEWRNNRLTALFAADYCANLVSPNENYSEEDNKLENFKSAISYIGNELLENAMKFNQEVKDCRVKFSIYLTQIEDITNMSAIIFTENCIHSQRIEEFQELIEKLLAATPDELDELYVQQVEKTAEDEQSDASGLGLLTLINDYSAKLGWKLGTDPHHPQVFTVTTMAQFGI